MYRCKRASAYLSSCHRYESRSSIYRSSAYYNRQLRCDHSLTPRRCHYHALHPSCILFIEPTISLLVMRSTSFVALPRLNFESITHLNMFVDSSCYVRRPVIVSALAPLLIYCCTFLCSIIEDLCKLSRRNCQYLYRDAMMYHTNGAMT